MSESLRITLSYPYRMNVNGELTQLGLAANTDKAYFHNFTPIYERFLFDKRETLQTMIEVGVLEGGSMKMWDTYFTGAKLLLGLDITLEKVKPETQYSDRVKLEVCDPRNTKQLEPMMKKYSITPGSVDLIIDDASHIVSHQIVNLLNMWKYVKTGGMYIIEDVHTSVPSLIGRHAHLATNGGYMDVEIGTDERILFLMHGEQAFPGVPLAQIDHVAYFSNVETMSLTCIITKK
jgi:hypothetical protein